MLAVVADSLANWLEAHAARVLEQQRATVENAKLVATFLAAVAATLVATALQVGRLTWLDVLASVSLAGAVGAAWLVARRDRIDVGDIDKVLASDLKDRRNSIRNALQDEFVQAVHSNQQVVDEVRAALTASVAASAAAGLLSLVSLLLPIFGT